MLRSPRRLAAPVIAAVLALVGSALLVPTAALADTDPATGVPSTVSSDALPTVQTNGVVWTQKIVGDTVYVGGNFTQATPTDGSAAVARSSMLAYNLTSGALIASFAPTFNGQIRSIDASADGSRIYVAGDFNQVNGLSRPFVAALDPTTGAPTTFRPVPNGVVYSVAVASTGDVFLGGQFTSVSSTARARAAKVSAAGTLSSWAPAVADNIVRAVVVSPDASKVVLGGSFTAVNGVSNAGGGSAEVDANTGASLPWAVGSLVYNHGAKAAIYSLSSDGTNVYGTGYVFGSLTDGNLEGAFNASWNGGTINWIEDCHGDSYSIAPMGDAVYLASHEHECATVTDGFPQTEPTWTTQRSTAFTKAATGTLGHNPVGGYYDFYGQPAPTLLTWYPDLVPGSFTGQGQAAWSVAAGNGYVVLGGEFPAVNGVKQSGLTRFAIRSLAPNADGPRLSGTTSTKWDVNVASLSAGTARIGWLANYDRDNATLKYEVYRNGGKTPVFTTTAVSHGWWDRPQLGFIDSGLTPGSTVSYVVKASDPFGNSRSSASVSTVVSSGGSTSPYSNAVLADGASHFWRLGEATGTANYDWAGYDDLTDGTGVTLGAAGPITGDASTGATFSGADDASGHASTSVLEPGPQTFTVEAWFRTTTTRGGKIVGFGNASTGNSSSYDRHVYMTPDGRVVFGVYDGNTETVSSANAYNDGSWHAVTASLGSGGMALYIDGRRVAARTDAKVAQDYSGYWRVGGDSSWAGANYFAGDIADVAIYPTVKSSAMVKNHWQLSGHGTAAPASSDAYGASVFASNPDLYWRLDDAAGSTSTVDASGNGDGGSVQGGVSLGAPTSVTGSTGAASFNGSDGQIVATQAVDDPEIYTEELWFNTTTTVGGKLIGFGDAAAGTSGSYDRHIWMNDDGSLTFGTWTGQTNTVTTLPGFNDGKWHYVAASQSADGLKLYVDGTLVGANPTAQAQSYTGYWRLGGDPTWGGNSSNHFAGRIDEVAVYGDALSTSTIASHYALGSGTVNAAPSASFTATAKDLAVNVDGSASADSDGTVSSYAWDFGDGGFGQGATTSHTYASAGTYQVILTVTDDKGATGTVTKTVTVVAPNQKPTAAFTSSATGLGVAVDGSTSSDPDGSIASYGWDFGDGGTATGATASHSYTTAGTYSIVLTVTDNRGATSSVTRSLTVAPANQAPTAAFTSSSTGLALTVNGSTSSDPDGSVASYRWDFGDGGTATGASPSHLYTAAGTYSVTLTVTDNGGATGATTKTLTVAALNQKPTAAFTATSAALVVGVDGSTSSDPDGTVSSFAWDFGDGGTATGATTSHTYAAAGSYTVTLTVTDNVGGTASATHSVTVAAANRKPTAAFTSSASALVVGVDGSTSSDPDGTIASYAWSFGDGGTATGATASHTYAAAGTYQVALTVTDNAGDTGITTKNVTVSSGTTAGSTLATDAFGRTVTSGLGTADSGGSWTVPAAVTSFSVSSGAGRVSNKAGSTLSAYLSSVSSTSTDAQATFGLSSLPVGGSAYLGLVGRRVGSDDYSARLIVTATGATTIELQRSGTSLKTIKVTGLTAVAGIGLHLRLLVDGTSPTTISARAWADGNAQPSTWQISLTDTTASLQAAGSLGLRTYASSGVTNGPLAVTVDDLNAATVGAAPANQPPTASFVSTTSGLAAAFDGSASADPDGTVSGYAWDFGDGSTGAGITPQHIYSSGGTYTVTLVVRDDKGATATTNRSVQVTAPATGQLAADAFGRTVAGGLGTADNGGAWTIASSAASYSVGNGVASVSTKAGSTLSAYLNAVSSTSTDATVTVSPGVVPTGGTEYVSLIGRRVGSSDYNARLSLLTSGAVDIVLLRDSTVLATQRVSGLTYTAGSQLTVRLQVSGTSPTTLQARVWSTTGQQPTTWQVTATDSTAGLQAAGAIGIRTYTGGATTNGPVVTQWDDLAVRQIG